MEFYISKGTSRDCTRWKNVKINWEEFVKYFKSPVRTKETVQEYHNLALSQQGAIKDIGGFVGGFCVDGKRKINSIRERSLICLDLDNPTLGNVPKIPYRGLLHSTHKHTPDIPRYRIIIPLMKSLSSGEYEYVSRYIAKEIGVYEKDADKTTYQANRLMYWASCPIDGEYIFQEFEGDLLDGKAILEKNPKWKEEIFEAPNLDAIQKQIKKKQADPTQKKGVIGAFCKAYDIVSCIETFLFEEYEATSFPNRYHWIKGSTFGGVLLFENKFSYSFHDSDPATMRLCNSYDLIRWHKFAGREKDTLTFCASQEGVGAYLAQEEFGEEIEEWQKELKYAKNGMLKPIMQNFELILENTYKLDFDDFKKQPRINSRPYKSEDDSFLMSEIEKKYGVFNESKLKHSIKVVGFRNRYNPIRDWLDGLTWDGVCRIDNLLIDYFGAADNQFTREAIRKTLIAGVKRIYIPGCVVQHILTLRGAQFIGKSTFFERLCPDREYFSDSLTLHDIKDTKTSGEHLLGHWILEIPEMAGMRKAEEESVKAFVVRRSDKFRPAYGRVLESFDRQCIFFASTNKEYLTDITGNRRFWTVLCHNRNEKYEFELEQIWAEAKHYFNQGESLLLSEEALKLSKIAENENMEKDDRTSFIENFINRKLPLDWYSKSLADRIGYLNDELNPLEGELERSYISTAEIWCELYQRSKSDLKRQFSNEILRSFHALGYTEKVRGIYDNNYGRVDAYKKASY